VPWIRDQTGSNETPMLFVSACVFVGGVMTFVVLGYLTRHREAHAGDAVAGEIRPA
jgi:hypothetical protein